MSDADAAPPPTSGRGQDGDLVRGRFLGRRARTAQARAAVNVEVGIQQISTVVLHATALADRLESLPLAGDLDRRRERQERVQRLRAAAAAGQESLRRARRTPRAGWESRPAAGS